MPTDHRYPPQDAYLNVLSWLRDDIYPGLVGHPLDDRGIAAWVCDRFHVLYQTNSLEDAKHRLYEEIARVVHPPPAPDPGARVLRPMLGQLRIVNGSFSDDIGPRCVCLCHAGNLFLEWLQNRAKAEAVLDLIAATGYHGIRFWTRLRGEWWRLRSGEMGHEITPGWRDLLAAFLAECQQRRLVAHVAAGDLNFIRSDFNRHAYFSMLGEVVAHAGPTVALVEWANESRDTASGLGPTTAERDLRIVTDRGYTGLTALTAYTGWGGAGYSGADRNTLRTWTPASQQFTVVHDYRGGNWWDKLRYIFSGVYEGENGPPVRRLVWHGEPFGVGPLVSASDNKHELTSEVMALAAAQCYVGGGAWTFFSSPGVILGNERFEDQPGFAETPRVAAALEQVGRQYGVQWGRLRLTHGGTGRPNVFEIRGGDETSRIDQAIDNDRGLVFATAYGQKPFEMTSRWMFDHLSELDLSSGEWGNGDVFPMVRFGVRS